MCTTYILDLHMYIFTLCMYLSVILSVRRLLEVLLQLMDVLFERRGHIARLEEDGISGCIGVTVSQEFFFSTETFAFSCQTLTAVCLLYSRLMTRGLLLKNCCTTPLLNIALYVFYRRYVR